MTQDHYAFGGGHLGEIAPPKLKFRKSTLRFAMVSSKQSLRPQADPSIRHDRDDTHMLGAHFPEDVYRAFRVLAAKKGMTTRATMAEAFTDLFEKHDEPVPKGLSTLKLRRRRARPPAAAKP